MTRYFFHSRDGEQTHHDDVGVELPSDEAAISEAVRAVSDLMSETLRQRAVNVRIDVVDEAGESVAEAAVDFSVKALR